MNARAIAASLMVVATAACGRDSASPTAPTPGAEPVARLTVTVDSLGSSVAIPAVSRVRFDGTGSTAEGQVQYLVDYGDQTSGSGLTTEHVYANPGTYTATFTIVDAQGRRTSATRTVDVRAVQGEWFHAGFNRRADRVELRRLRLLAQDGRNVRAEAVEPRETIPVTATIEGERTLKYTLHGAVVEGQVPSTVFAEDAVMSLRGVPSMEGELPFAPIIGEPTGPPPVAQLEVQVDSYRSPEAILGLSPIRFSGTTSVADGPTYVFEFGDGESATGATAVHPCLAAGERIARLTVIDRFARVASASSRYRCFSLAAGTDSYTYWWNFAAAPDQSRTEQRRLYIATHSGTEITGVYIHPPGIPTTNARVSRFTGRLSGERSIRMVLEGGGIEFTGDVILPESGRYMTLTLRGGSADGQTLKFELNQGY